MKALLSLLVLLLLTPAAGASPLEEGLAAYKAEDYETAAALLLPLAEQGDAVAQAYVGRLYYHGRYLEKNLVLAADWFEKSALQGNADGQFLLGSIYYRGEGRPIDRAAALHFFELSARQCDTTSMTEYASMILLGEETEKNIPLAFAWYTIAAEIGVLFGEQTVESVSRLLAEDDYEKSERYIQEIKEDLSCI